MQVTSASSKEGRLGDVTKILGVLELLGDFVALIFADDENVTEEKENKQDSKENKTKHTPEAKNVSIKCRGKDAVHSTIFYNFFPHFCCRWLS